MRQLTFKMRNMTNDRRTPLPKPCWTERGDRWHRPSVVVLDIMAVLDRKRKTGDRSRSAPVSCLFDSAHGIWGNNSSFSSATFSGESSVNSETSSTESPRLSIFSAIQGPFAFPPYSSPQPGLQLCLYLPQLSAWSVGPEARLLWPHKAFWPFHLY